MSTTTKTTKKKIPLPWMEEEIEAQILREKKTIQFWRVSRAWNGFGTPLTCHSAMSQLNNVIVNVDPNKKLVLRSQELLNNIINHGSKSNLIRHLKKNPSNPDKQDRCKMILL